jgi:hypothetical protein
MDTTLASPAVADGSSKFIYGCLNRHPDAARRLREWMILCSPRGSLFHRAGTVWVSAIL